MHFSGSVRLAGSGRWLGHFERRTIFMNSDQDKTLKLVIQSLHEWWAGLGAVAWVLLGVVLLVAIALMLLLLRWIWRGGLSRQTAFGFFHDRRKVDE